MTPTPPPSQGPEGVRKILDAWTELYAILDKDEKTWAEECVVGAGRYMEIKAILPYIRSLEAENAVLRDQREEALTIAYEDGQIDGDHHKAWVIDQMVRALTGCPDVEATANDYQDKPYTFTARGESAEYKKFVRKAKRGEDGPDSYDWDTGIAP